eukprot:scaffold5460_cov153-Skeletonema_dohrnii-CCMP3373.AAC.20
MDSSSGQKPAIWIHIISLYSRAVGTFTANEAGAGGKGPAVGGGGERHASSLFSGDNDGEDNVNVTSTDVEVEVAVGGDDSDSDDEEQFNNDNSNHDPNDQATNTSYFGFGGTASSSPKNKIMLSAMGILFLVLATCFCLAIRATAKENHASFVNNFNSVVSPTSAKTKSSKPHSPRPPHAKSSKGGGGVEPSSSPDNFPSLKPSNDPSASPSGSSKPSSQPSLTPSQSAQPSSQPSLNPSLSGQPSLDPSASPSESREPSSQPSLTPSQSAQPSSRLCGPQTASYDESLGAPKCSIGSSCDSGTTLNGRGTILNGNEPNHPNTLNSCCCVDGNSGTYHDEESIDRIVVTRASGGESESDCELTEGDPVTITATVWCWEEGSNQYIDFYYASDALNPVWIKIGDRQPCPGGGLQNMTASYSLPQGSIQAVRANLMFGRADPGVNSCTRGNFDDTDDLVITVVQIQKPSSEPSLNPSLSGQPSLIFGSFP